MRQTNIVRKSAPGVKSGQVQKKNDWALTPNYYSHTQRELVIDRKRPGAGYRHLLLKRDILDFIAILPDWAELSRGLDALVLSPGDPELYGYHTEGVVHICAWPTSLWIHCTQKYYDLDRWILQRLHVACERDKTGYWCKYTEHQAKAFQLLNIFLHELAHHRDRMTTKSQERVSRGENFAERYARVNANHIWTRYEERFDLE